jgi:hypothetical protein
LKRPREWAFCYADQNTIQRKRMKKRIKAKKDEIGRMEEKGQEKVRSFENM